MMENVARQHANNEATIFEQHLIQNQKRHTTISLNKRMSVDENMGILRCKSIWVNVARLGCFSEIRL
jgi:hypothetical protein